MKRYEVIVRMGTALWTRDEWSFLLGQYRWLWCARLAAWWHVGNHPYREAIICRIQKDVDNA